MDIDSILFRNSGFVTRATLYSAGISKRRLQRELAAGRLTAYGRDVIGTPRAPAVFRRAVRMKCRIACVTAAKANGLWVLTSDAFHVVPRVINSHVARDAASPTAKVHWSPAPLEPDHSRLAIESGRNALAHIADCQPLDSAVATFDSAVRKGLISLEELGRLASVRRGRFAKVVALVSDSVDSGAPTWRECVCRSGITGSMRQTDASTTAARSTQFRDPGATLHCAPPAPILRSPRVWGAPG